MKKYFKVISVITALILIVSLQGCSNNNQVSEISVEEISLVSRVLTSYEKNVLEDSVESPLNVACTTLYECVCTGSITRKSAVGKFSFADKLPLDNASPSEKRKTANALTLKDAIEYFGLEEVYSDNNINEYGYLSLNYNEKNLIKGTIIKIETIKNISHDYIQFQNTDIKLGDFINAYLLLN